MIPKKIHYCWFGQNPPGELNLRSRDSWHRVLPDYEIKLWDETNVPLYKAYARAAHAGPSDGSAQRRISFGGAAYAAPDWSPDGEWIAFTRREPGGRRIGIVRPDGTGERLLTNGPADEGASWAPSSRELIFQRTDAAGNSSLYRVSLDGSAPRSVALPQGASDPDWSGVVE